MLKLINRFKRKSIHIVLQKDGMQCGVACLSMISSYYGRFYSLDYLTRKCFPTKEGVSLLSISKTAEHIGLDNLTGLITVEELLQAPLPCILHWSQNHFVVLYKVTKAKKFYIADPAKGKTKMSYEEFCKHWCCRTEDNCNKGVAMFFEPNKNFYSNLESDESEIHSLSFLNRYIKSYKRYLFQILIGLLLGCILQLILPFLTQSIVDIGINQNDIGFIWMVLLGELMIVIGRTATDFIRRWLLLHISMRINISLVSDFFIKLLKLPMSFFDTKLMGDLLQRINDHSRVQSFLTNQVLGVIFTFLSFIIFGIVLFIYNKFIFSVFMAGSIVYGLWIMKFLQRRKIIDYELFEQQAKKSEQNISIHRFYAGN